MRVVLFLFLANIYDMGGTLGIKYVSFFVASGAIVTAATWFDLSIPEILVGVGLFVIWPTWSLLYGVAQGADLSLAVSQVTPFLFACVLAVLLPAIDARSSLRMLYWSIFSLAIVIVGLFAVLLAAPQSGLGAWVMAFLGRFQEQEGYFGTAFTEGIESPIIYFRAALFLVPTFVYLLYTGKTFRALLVLLALALSLSKAGVLISLVFLLVFPFGDFLAGKWRSPNANIATVVFGPAKKILPIGIIALMSIGFLLWSPNFGNQMWAALTSESETALVRKGHIESVIELFHRHPGYLLTGQGAGTSFFSVGELNEVTNIEVDHLNTIRKFGLPWFIAFSCVVLYVAKKLIRDGQTERRAFGFALVSSYLASGTNPVLVTPLFIMLMVASYFAQRRPELHAA
jgi:hypothetical protein